LKTLIKGLILQTLLAKEVTIKLKKITIGTEMCCVHLTDFLASLYEMKPRDLKG